MQIDFNCEDILDNFPSFSPTDPCSPIVILHKYKASKNVKAKIHKTQLALCISVSVDLDLFNAHLSSKGAGRADHDAQSSTVNSSSNNPYYLHVEYDIPHLLNGSCNTDVVLFSKHFARVYPSKLKNQNLIPWSDGRSIWISWIEQHTIEVTEEKLRKFAKANSKHGVFIRIWNMREKCDIKTRFDRPKPPKYSQLKLGQDPEMLGGAIKGLVVALSKQSEKHPSMEEKDRLNLPHILLRRVARNSLLSAASTRMSMSGVSSKASDQGKTKELDNENMIYLVPQGVPPNKRSYEYFQELAGNVDSVEKEIALPKTKKARPSSKASTKSKKMSKMGTPLSKRRQSSLKDRCETETESTWMEWLRTDIPDRSSLESREKQSREQIMRQGNGFISINTSTLFSAKSNKSIFERMNLTEMRRLPTDSKRTINEVFIKLLLLDDLMSVEMRETLKPVVVTLKSMSDLTPFPFKNFREMEEYCEPMHFEYSWGDKIERATPSYKSRKSIKLFDSQVCEQVLLLGDMENSEITNFFLKESVTIKVFDRNLKKPNELPEILRSKSKQRVYAAKAAEKAGCIFGKDPRDSMISKIDPTLLTDDQKPSELLPTVYGLAETKFDEFLHTSSKTLIVNVPLSNADLQVDNKEIEMHKSKTEMLGRYKEDATTLSVQVEKAFESPLINPNESERPLKCAVILLKKVLVNETIELDAHQNKKSQSNFSRNVNRIEEIMADISYEIMKNNASCLDLDNQSNGLHCSTLGLISYSDVKKQQHKYDLDKYDNLITGFCLVDPLTTIYVIEYRDLSCIHEVLDSHLNENYLSFIYNDDLAITSRRFTDMDLLLTNYQLPILLRALIQHPLLYVRDVIPKVAFEGVTRLNTMISSEELNLSKVLRCDLLPTQDMVKCIVKEFTLQRNQSSLNTTSRLISAKNIIATRNTTHYESVMEKEQASNDENAAKNKSIESAEVPVIGETYRLQIESNIHNYSSQSFNSTEVLKDKLYKDNIIRSKTSLPINQLDVFKQELRASTSLMHFQRPDWTYPGVKSSLQSQKTISMSRFHESQRDNLSLPWNEGELFASKLKPTLPERDDGTTPISSRLFNSYVSTSQPKCLEKVYTVTPSIYDMRPLQSLDKSSPKLAVYRRCPSTEMIWSGMKSSCQLDKLVGLRKSPAKKIGICIEDMPSLTNVLWDEKYDEEDAKRDKIAYKPIDDITVSFSKQQIARV